MNCRIDRKKTKIDKLSINSFIVLNVASRNSLDFNMFNNLVWSINSVKSGNGLFIQNNRMVSIYRNYIRHVRTKS